ncbi:methyltransferase-like protein 22 isoform X2 [Photinus pyralis]|uniref:methyltransferase-like protein 22 isoform X2 n=1 Tax=Photinus pyralis TaxID=7054 RepID=UPI0012676A64|nr:methyltransferase-like protein 22 isoform X2 [Photinus pyralis]
MEVSSELYSEFEYETDSKPTVDPCNVVSKFSFIYPISPTVTDSDGDLVVRRKSEEKRGIIEIEHSKRTELSLVGLQVWRGALLLADWILYIREELIKRNLKILELGSGTGLTSIVASMFSDVICTDVNKEIDFTQRDLNNEVISALPHVKTIIAADVIYDDQLTQDFVKMLDVLLAYKHIETVYIALEKRYVFTIADCDVCAPCYDFFMDCLGKLKGISVEELPINFPQYFQYERVKELVLLKIKNTK